MEEFEKVKDRLKGAWIISTTPRRRGEPSDVDKAIQGSGVVGRVAGSPTELVFTGEEEGLLGSQEYVKQHSSELEKISTVFIDDMGTNYLSGLTCTAEMEPMLTEAIEPAKKAFPDMPMEIRTTSRIPRFGGSDHFPIQVSGVPAVFWRQSGNADYRFFH